MKNYLLRIAYDGSSFHGFQLQEGHRTVNGVLQQSIEKLTRRPTRLIAAGRTDAGVHAEDQAINFLTTTEISPEGFSYHLQKELPGDILCLSSQKVPLGFHARFACESKTYRYVISLRRPMMPTERLYKAACSYDLDLAVMEKGLRLFEGEHDFRYFCKYNPLRQPVRTIDSFTMERVGDDLVFRIKAESFLHNQIRLMIGAMVELGRGQFSLEDIQVQLLGKEKRMRQVTYPASGLTLEKLELNDRSNRFVKSV